jgi:hypothetical protein
MTSATYETSTFAGLPSAHDVRRPLGGSFSSAYDVSCRESHTCLRVIHIISFQSPYSTLRRRSPSPGPSSRRYPPYDSYVPRGGPSHRNDDHPNMYRPNTWRQERYNSRSPSPDRYERSRPTEPRTWDSSSRWQPSWPDRRSSPSPPPPRGGLRRDTMAERMFEPSDSWKQSHVDRSGRYEPFVHFCTAYYSVLFRSYLGWKPRIQGLQITVRVLQENTLQRGPQCILLFTVTLIVHTLVVKSTEMHTHSLGQIHTGHSMTIALGGRRSQVIN